MSREHNISPFNNNGKEKLSDDKLMAYLEGKLPPSEQHDIEQWLSEEGMESDALEGFRIMRPEDTLHTVNKLKHELRKKITGKKQRRRRLRTDHFTFMAIAIILLLVVVAYIVIRFAGR